MATLENNLDSIPCRNCGNPVRPGMIRCRECRTPLVDAGDEFVLSPQVAAAARRKCSRCGTPMEKDWDDCAHCASALLDDLMNGPREIAVPDADTEEFDATGTAALMTPARRTGGDSRKNARPAIRRDRPPRKAAGRPQDIGAAGSPSIDEEPPGLFGDDDSSSSASRIAVPATQAPVIPAETTDAPAGPVIETSAACAALLSSLAAANDVNLRCEIATALGKLGDRAAVAPLERHLVDPEVRIRRAVAAALIQLGHPKGETLLDIAERKPAASVVAHGSAKSAPHSKAKRSGGGFEIDGAAVKKLGVGFMALAVVGGGIWYWMNSAPAAGRKRKKKGKPVAVRTTSLAPSELRNVFVIDGHPRDWTAPAGQVNAFDQVGQ